MKTTIEIFRCPCRRGKSLRGKGTHHLPLPRRRGVARGSAGQESGACVRAEGCERRRPGFAAGVSGRRLAADPRRRLRGAGGVDRGGCQHARPEPIPTTRNPLLAWIGRRRRRCIPGEDGVVGRVSQPWVRVREAGRGPGRRSSSASGRRRSEGAPGPGSEPPGAGAGWCSRVRGRFAMAVTLAPRPARTSRVSVDVLRRRGWNGTMDGLPTVDGRDGAGDGGRNTGPLPAGGRESGGGAGDDG